MKRHILGWLVTCFGTPLKWVVVLLASLNQPQGVAFEKDLGPPSPVVSLCFVRSPGYFRETF